MVIKRASSGRKEARVNAARKWKRIGHKIVLTVQKVGLEAATKMLHGYDKIVILEYERPIEKRPIETRHGIANVVAEASQVLMENI